MSIFVDILIANLLLTLYLYKSAFLRENNELVFQAMYEFFASIYTILVQYMKNHIIWLMGWPAGLKLNDDLDNALGGLAIAGLDWWLDLLRALTTLVSEWLTQRNVQLLFSYEVGICIFFCLFGGFSCWLGFLSDLITILTAALQLFYMVSHKLFTTVWNAIFSFWRLFRGIIQDVY